MKKRLGLLQLAHYTYQGLKSKGMEVTLSGGACVSIYTDNAYRSLDLDFIRHLQVPIAMVAEAMTELGFAREGRHFNHPESDFFVEFPPPPLTVGNEAPTEAGERILRKGRSRYRLKMLSPTDCVKDRLCQFFYWNDRRALDQAIMVAINNEVDRSEVEKWAGREKMKEKCSEFLAMLAKKRRSSARSDKA